MKPRPAPILLLTLAASAQAVDLRAPQTGNPIVPGYFADPCLRKFGDTYYLYSTPDGWANGTGIPLIWSSKDFVNWTPHRSNWPVTREKWAPSVVERGGKYYMFSSVPLEIHVGVADHPLGPWRPARPQGPLLNNQEPPGTITLDAEVFIDDDNQAYLSYGTWWTPTMVKLGPDLLALADKPVQYFRKPETTTPLGLIQGCMEAPYMIKRNGTYFLMYSDFYCQNSSYQVKYSVAKSPMGPFTYGTQNPILATTPDLTVEGPGHHSMFTEGGKDFIAYHRHAKPFRNDSMFRQLAVDQLHFGPGDTILPVKPTHRGIGFLAPSTKRDTNWVVASQSKVTATASSVASSDFAPVFAADENNATLWKADSPQFPQWLQINLGDPRPVKRTEIDFHYPQVNNFYKVEASLDGKAWQTIVDRTAPSDWSPAVDTLAKTTQARHIRVTLTGTDTPNHPNPEIGIWNVKVYDGIDKPFGPPKVDAGPDQTLTTDAPRLNLPGLVLDPGLPCTSVWKQTSGPAPAKIQDPADPQSPVEFPAPGRYVLTLEAQNAQHKAADTLVVEVKVPANPLIAQYEFNESLGETLRDETKTAKNGWLSSDGDIKTPPRRASGLTGQALAFDGAQSFAALPPLAHYEDFAFTAWVKLDRVQNAVLAASVDGQTRLFVDPQGKVSLVVKGNDPERITAPQTLTNEDIGRWIHVAAEVKAQTRQARITLDGQPTPWTALTTANPVDLTSGLRLGADDQNHLEGKLDSVRLYRTSLPPVELTTLAKHPARTTVASLDPLPDGTEVELRTVTVTYAPRDLQDRRNTRWFYIADPDQNARTIQVRLAPDAPQDNVEQDRGLTLQANLQTDPETNERYLLLAGNPEIESAPRIQPIPSDLATLSRLPAGRPVSVQAQIADITQDRRTLRLNSANGQTLQAVFSGLPVPRIVKAAAHVTIVGVPVREKGETKLWATALVQNSPTIDPLDLGLVARFPFDETTGTTAENATGESAAATLVRAAFGPGQTGNALLLSGNRAHTELPDLGTMRALTVAMWIKLDVLRPWQAILHTDQFEPSRKLHLSVHEQGHLLLAISGNSPVDVRSRPAFTTADIDNWKHLALVYDADARTAKIYIDGVLHDQFAYNKANPIALSNGMSIGSWNGNDRFLQGGIDDLRIYRRPLTTQEIGRLAQKEQASP